jgi:hypothetical protein
MTDFRSELGEKVREAMAADERTADLNIDVTDNNGVITLEGRTPSDEARRAAGEVAKGVPGVAEVINDIQLGEEAEVESGLPATLAGEEDQTGVSSSLP